MFSWDQPFQLQSILFNLVVENLLHTCDSNASKKCMRYSHHNAKASNLAPRVHVPLHMPTGNDACALHLIKLRLLTFAMFTMWNKIQALGNEKENFLTLAFAFLMFTHTIACACICVAHENQAEVKCQTFYFQLFSVKTVDKCLNDCLLLGLTPGGIPYNCGRGDLIGNFGNL